MGGRTVVHPLAFPPVERAISHAGRCGLRNVLSTLSNEGPLCTRSPSHPWSERFCVRGDAASETFFSTLSNEGSEGWSRQLALFTNSCLSCIRRDSICC